MFAIIFDFDGTLVDLNLHVNAIRKELEEYYAAHGYEIKVTRITKTIESAPAHLKKGAWEILKKHELAAVPRSRPVDGAARILEWAKSVGKTAIVSLNSREAIVAALKLHGFPPVDVIVGREDAPQPKPAPDGILVVLRRLSVEPSSAIMVGDSDSDMLAASKAGVIPIGLARTHFTPEILRAHGARVIIKSLEELPDIFLSIVAKKP